MKKQTFLNYGKTALYAVLTVLCAFSVISAVMPELAETLVAFIGLGSTGGAAVAAILVPGADTRDGAETARPRSETDPGHLVDDVSQMVTKIQPDKFFLDTMLRSIKNSSEKAKNIEVFFEEVEFRGSEDVITAALAAPTGETDADKYRDISVANSDLWVMGETIYLPEVLVSGKPLQLRIDEKNADGTLKVTAINTGNQVVPAIPDETKLFRSATSYGEMKASAESVTQYPDIRSNYCQRFMAQVEESYIRKLVAAKSGFSAKDQNFMRLYDMRAEIEKSSIFGTKGKIFSKKENAFVTYADGVFHQASNQLGWTAGGGITNDTWIDWTNSLFSGNAGSDDRLALVGSDLLAAILKIPSVQKQQENNMVEIVPGSKVQKVETSFGIIYLKKHELFNTMGHRADGVVLDMTNIKKRPFINMNKRKLNLRDTGIKNVDAVLFEEMSCLELRYLDTHARIVKTA